MRRVLVLVLSLVMVSPAFADEREREHDRKPCKCRRPPRPALEIVDDGEHAAFASDVLAHAKKLGVLHCFHDTGATLRLSFRKGASRAVATWSKAGDAEDCLAKQSWEGFPKAPRKIAVTLTVRKKY